MVTCNVMSMMSTFLYTLLGIAVGSSLHCSVRREISPCTCRAPDKGPVQVVCERLSSFNQIVNILNGKFPPYSDISLRVAHSQLEDLEGRSFGELGFTISNLKLNYDNISETPVSFFSGLDKVEYLSLADNNIAKIPQYILKQMPNIKTLDLGRNNFKELKSSDLEMLPKLKYLVLAGNEIENIDQFALSKNVMQLHIGLNELKDLNGSLRHLSQLDWLFINSNKLTSLEDQLPLEGNKMLLFHAGNNKLEYVPKDFRRFQSLQTLILPHNSLKSLNGNLQKCKKLERLHLEFNNLEVLFEDDFLDLTSLENLQLGFNSLTSLNNSLRPLKELRCLNLTHNYLENFSLQEIRGLNRLLIVDLSYNKISEMRGRMENVVEPETRVVELRLEGNFLTSLDGSLIGLHGLQRLNLSHNQLTKIAPDDFLGMNELRLLDISFNQLTTLEETSKSFLPSLEELIATHNSLTALGRDFHGLPVLCWADLSHNKIKSVGRDLVGKTRCKIHGVPGILRVYLHGNPVLCDTTLLEIIQAIEMNYTKIHGVQYCPATPLS